MNFNAGIKEIGKNLNHIYFVCGKEKYLSQKIQEAITNKVVADESDDTNLLMFHSDPEFHELVSAVETMPFFGGNNLIIIKQTNLFKAGWDYHNQHT